MKQTLQLKLGQSLTMTPQLQQAIRLLQLSSLELQAEIQEILESNPLLDAGEEGDSEDSSTNEQSADSQDSTTSNTDNKESGAEATSDSQEDYNENLEVAGSGEGDIDTSSDVSDIPDDLPVDSNWEDTYDYAPSRASG